MTSLSHAVSKTIQEFYFFRISAIGSFNNLSQYAGALHETCSFDGGDAYDVKDNNLMFDNIAQDRIGQKNTEYKRCVNKEDQIQSYSDSGGNDRVKFLWWCSFPAAQ